ncbi:MAG: hypothetical protein AAFR68_08335 [Pseudomonadota bacterium]
MAALAEWRGAATSLLPTTTWAAPNGLISGTAVRNDDDAYAFNATTSTITLPSSGLADGYLIVAAFEFNDTSNGRHNPQLRITQASGTGDFGGSPSTGYNRDSSEDISWCRTWGFVHNPSANATFQIQWRRDSDAPTGGTTQAHVQVIPLYYSNHGIYASTVTACPGNTTASQVTGFSATSESDTAAIEIAGNTVTLKGDNKRYLCLGGYYWQGVGSSRTQRLGGFIVDGSIDEETYAYSYGRNAANADIGELFTTILDRATADITLAMGIYRGPSVSPFPAYGADVAGNTSGGNPSHAMVILELNDSAEVIRTHNNTQQNLRSAGTDVDIQIADVVNFNDATSFTQESATAINVELAADVLVGANIAGGYGATSTARYTGRSHITLNGSEQQHTRSGNYGRGNQGSQDCWGWSSNNLSFLAVAANDNIGASAGKIAGGESGTVDSLPGLVGFWALNLDTLEGGSAAHNLGALGVSSEASVGTASFGQAHDLTSAIAESSAEVEASAVQQIHALAGQSVAAGAEVGPGDLGQTHAMTAVEAQSFSAVAAASMSQEADLVGSAVQSQSQVDSPSIGQRHDLGSTGLVSAASVGSAGFGTSDQIAGLAISSRSEVALAVLVQGHALSAVPIVAASGSGTAALVHVHGLSGAGAEAASAVERGSIGQGHFLAGSPVAADARVGLAGFDPGETVNLVGDAVSASSEIAPGVFEQVHGLSGEAVLVSSSVGSGAHGQAHALQASPVASAGEVDQSGIGAPTILLAESVTAASEVPSASFAQRQAFSGLSVVSVTQVVSSAIAQQHQLQGNVVSTATRAGNSVLGGPGLNEPRRVLPGRTGLGPRSSLPARSSLGGRSNLTKRRIG